MLFYNAFHNFKNVLEEDVFFGVLVLEVVISKLSLDYLQPKLKEFNRDIEEKFWSNKSLQIDFSRDKKLFGLLLFLLAFAAVVALVLVAVMPMTWPRCIYNEKWGWCFKVIFKIIFFLYIWSSFCIAITNMCYFVYLALHYRLQMKILIKYIKREMGNYERMQLLHKIYSDLYQEEVRQISLMSIKYYQILKM